MNARASGTASAVAVLCALLAPSAFAADAAARIAVTPAGAHDDPVVVEALKRLPYELADVGFAAPDDEAGQRADFVVGISRARDGIVVSVTAAGPPSATALLRTVVLTDVAGRGSDQASTIAIRAVEVLRAIILQASASAAAVTPPPPNGGRAPPATLAPMVTGWAVGAGPSVLSSFRGFGTGWGLAAHAALRLRESLSLEIEAAAPLLQADLRAPDGAATVHQQLLGAAVRHFFRSSRRVRPSASLSGGVYHVSVDGHARVGPLTSGLTAPFVAAGLGLMLTRGGSFALQLQARLLFVQPAPYVVIGAADAGHAGQPLALVTLELEWHRGFGRK